MPFKPFSPVDELRIHHQHLPHWRQEGVTYFVTSRLADALPENVLAPWRSARDAWLRSKGLGHVSEADGLPDEERHEFHRLFTARFHRLLDAGHGSCCLRDRECAALLIQQFTAGHGTGYELDCWVIMPNHFHALVSPVEGVMLGSITKQWKGASARFINLRLGRSGSLWQDEGFDHIVRSEAQFQHYRKYITENPAKAGLSAGYTLGFGNEPGLDAENLRRKCGI